MARSPETPGPVPSRRNGIAAAPSNAKFTRYVAAQTTHTEWITKCEMKNSTSPTIDETKLNQKRMPNGQVGVRSRPRMPQTARIPMPV